MKKKFGLAAIRIGQAFISKKRRDFQLIASENIPELCANWLHCLIVHNLYKMATRSMSDVNGLFFFSRLLSHGGYQLIRDKENARTKIFHSRHFLAPGTTFLISATYIAHLAMQEKTDYDKMPLAVTKPHVSNHSNFLMCCFWRRDITGHIVSLTILV